MGYQDSQYVYRHGLFGLTLWSVQATWLWIPKFGSMAQVAPVVEDGVSGEKIRSHKKQARRCDSWKYYPLTHSLIHSGHSLKGDAMESKKFIPDTKKGSVCDSKK